MVAGRAGCRLGRKFWAVSLHDSAGFHTFTAYNGMEKEGKGYGIIDDCGGIFGLVNIFEKKNTDWGEYNINDFDLKKTNRIIDNYL